MFFLSLGIPLIILLIEKKKFVRLKKNIIFLGPLFAIIIWAVFSYVKTDRVAIGTNSLTVNSFGLTLASDPRFFEYYPLKSIDLLQAKIEVPKNLKKGTRSLEDFKECIETSGHVYWGDYMLLQLLCEILKINIFILKADEYENDYSIYNTMCEYKRDYDTIFLILENDSHFKLLGYFKDKMISYFDNKNIPIELKRLFKLKE